MDTEWALVFFTLFAALSTGTFVGIVVSEWLGKAEQIRFRGALLALVTLAISGFSSVLHLGHPERIFGALGHPTSGIFMEALLIGLFGLDLIAYLIALRKKVADRSRKVIAGSGLIPAVLLSFAVGYTYVMPSRPAWDTLLLPLLYVASAAVIGCFSVSVLLAGTDAVPYRTTMAALGIQGLLTFCYVVYLAFAPYQEETRSAMRVLTGDLAVVFWVGLVLIGLLIPAAIIRTKKATVVGLLCVLAAGVAFRMLMFSLGSSIRTFF